MMVSCRSRMRVPSVNASVKVGCTSTGIASATATGLGEGASSLTRISFELRVIGTVFISASSEINTTKIAVLFVCIFGSPKADSEVIEESGLCFVSLLAKSDKLSLFAHSRATFAPSFQFERLRQDPTSVTAEDVRMYFQAISNLGHFLPPGTLNAHFFGIRGQA